MRPRSMSLSLRTAVATAAACASFAHAAAAQAPAAPDAGALAGAMVRYARFVADAPLDDAARRAIAAATVRDLRVHPDDAAADARVAAFLATAGRLGAAAREAARTSAWNLIVRRAAQEGGARDALTAAVLRANPAVATDPATGISVSRHAFAGYAASIARTASLAGRPQLGTAAIESLTQQIATAFPSYPPEAQRDIADGAERWAAFSARLEATGDGPLAVLRTRLAAGVATPADAQALSQFLEDAVARATFDDLIAQTQDAFAQAFRAFGGR